MSTPAPARSRAKRPTPAQVRQRRLLALGGAALVTVVGVVAIVMGMNRSAKPVPTPTVTVPAPTPTVSAIAAPSGTALAGLIPTQVATLALTEATTIDTGFRSTHELKKAGAFEAYRLTYTDGSATLIVTLAQFATADAATTYAGTLTAQKPADTVTQPVMVGSTQVGTANMWGENCVWTNDTVTVAVTGPAAKLATFFKAFSL